VLGNSTVLEKPTKNSSGNTAAIRIEHTKELRVPLIVDPTADQLRTQSEAILETCITQAFVQLINAPTHEWRMQAWEEFAGLIRQRSPEHVARLEKEKLERCKADYGKRAVTQ
jgi:hypothetical protein